MLSFTSILAASSIVALSFATPLSFEDSSCTICVDRVNDCGKQYGGCYDFCKEPRKEFEIPKCNNVSGKKQICEYVKSECGTIGGGCYPEDGPIPGWAAPECPPKEEPKPKDESCQICVEQVNDCQKMYGGCYDFCAENSKVFDIPECNGSSGKQQVCEYFKNDCGKVFGGCYPAGGPAPLWEEPKCPAA